MSESQGYLERERRRIDEQAAALAKDKARILPKPRYAEPPPTPDPTLRDFRKWQWSILGLMFVFNLGPLFNLLTAPPESFKIIVKESQTAQFRDVATGEASYLVEFDSDDVRPKLRKHDQLPLPAWAVATVALCIALAYTRYRMGRTKSETPAHARRHQR